MVTTTSEVERSAKSKHRHKIYHMMADIHCFTNSCVSYMIFITIVLCNYHAVEYVNNFHS